ncbi:MAG: DNA repair protein RecO [Bacteroidales bacterium]|nr:DNA repair protein RecO [Bacteroidales bacterium]
MIVSTSGIVLHSTKYSDTSLIVKIFTEAQGTQSFIVKGAFGKKSRIRASMFAPMALVHLTYAERSNDQLQFIKDISREDPASSVSFDPVKSALLLFYNELIYKILLESSPDPVLFHFLKEEITKVNEADTCPPDLPLRFLIRLSIILGFFPENNYSKSTPYFSLTECKFQHLRIDERTEMPDTESHYLSQLLNNNVQFIPNRQTRNTLLHYLIEYYKIHNDQLKDIESVEILATVLH